MLNIGPAEMVVIGIIVLLAVGPEQLPSVIRKTGNLVSQIRSVTDGFKSDFMAGIEEIEQAADLDKLSEKIVDPFNPATFEAQSKMSKRASANDDTAFDDSVYADRPDRDSSGSVDSDVSEVDDNDNDNDQDEDESNGADPSDEVDPSDQVDPDEAQLKAAKKREKSAVVVEAMHNIESTPQAGSDSLTDEGLNDDSIELTEPSSDLLSDRDEQLDSTSPSEDGVAE